MLSATTLVLGGLFRLKLERVTKTKNFDCGKKFKQEEKKKKSESYRDVSFVRDESYGFFFPFFDKKQWVQLTIIKVEW